jgi:hypothetical protein
MLKFQVETRLSIKLGRVCLDPEDSPCAHAHASTKVKRYASLGHQTRGPIAGKRETCKYQEELNNSYPGKFSQLA